MTGQFISYYRVSTAEQGRSGLGLEAQKAAVLTYLNGGQWELIGEFIEVESGKRADRPELDAAIKLCRKRKATLVIAKLDRLARDVHFISGLMKCGVKFVAADLPTADPFMLHVYAAVAEQEARAISSRTKAALACAKERGVVLGKNGAKLAKKNAAAARKAAVELKPIVDSLRASGIASVRGITEALNSRNIPTPQGKRWHSTSVHRLLCRLNEEAA